MTEAFDEKRVLVTGADGFIGSHLVEQLARAGAFVRAFSHYNSWNNIGWLADADPKFIRDVEIFRGDVRDTERVRQAVHGCHYVFHLSSLIGIPYSYDAPRSYVETNVTGALNILEACRHSDSLIRLVHTSTSEVYGTAQTVPISERHPLVGQSPYAATKIAADKLAESFHLSFKLPVATARPFNTYGPRQTARAVIPTIASQLLSGAPSLKLGSLATTRDFNYVLDTVSGMMALALSQKAEGHAINIGTGHEWSIEQTARMLIDITGREIPIVCEDTRIRPAASEVSRLIADNTLIKSLTGWTPQTQFREGLERTAEWVGRNVGLFSPAQYSV